MEAIDTTVYSKSNCIFERYRLRRLNEHVFVTNHKLGKTRSKKVFWDGLLGFDQGKSCSKFLMTNFLWWTSISIKYQYCHQKPLLISDICYQHALTNEPGINSRGSRSTVALIWNWWLYLLAYMRLPISTSVYPWQQIVWSSWRCLHRKILFRICYL